MAAVSEYLKSVTRYELQQQRAVPRGMWAAVVRAGKRAVGLPVTAPPMPGNPIYMFCEEYQALSLWDRYHAFRMNPCARTWRELRRQRIPWLQARKLAAVIALFMSNRIPDVDTVTRTLLTFEVAAPAAKPKTTKARRR